ncbi:MAG: helix-turn-helix domain-containing protein, partial [Desulfuromonadales bacterium]|nr:helix-turn-helix domain-containing protein [Desulfuromonadales bacterium]
SERINEGRERAKAAGVKFGRKPKLTKAQENSLSEWINRGIFSKEELAQKFNISVSTLYRWIAVMGEN